jgi:threonine/homoserine/homoserine lactone efflux protein
LIAFCLTETALCFVPGPAVLFVVSVALARGRGGIAAARGSRGQHVLFRVVRNRHAAVIVASNELFTG